MPETGSGAFREATCSLAEGGALTGALRISLKESPWTGEMHQKWGSLTKVSTALLFSFPRLPFPANMRSGFTPLLLFPSPFVLNLLPLLIYILLNLPPELCQNRRVAANEDGILAHRDDRRARHTTLACVSYQRCSLIARLVRGGNSGRWSTSSKSSSAAMRLKRSKPQPRQRCTRTYSPPARWKLPMGSIDEPQVLMRSPGVWPSTWRENRQ